VALEPLTPATFLREELPRIGQLAGGRPVLDLACGRGRNALAAAAAGLRVVALDRDADALAELGVRAAEAGLDVARVRADLERGEAIPFADDSFGAVLVFRYLHRPLAREIVRVLAPGGVLVYETFTLVQRVLGWGPRSDEFLLDVDELWTLFGALRHVRSEEGLFQESGEREAALGRFVGQKRG
jgi:SAM-dependent methyltransferase